MISICDTFCLSNNGKYFLMLLAFERSLEWQQNKDSKTKQKEKNL